MKPVAGLKIDRATMVSMRWPSGAGRKAASRRPLAEQSGQSGAAHGNGGAADFDLKQVVERLMTDDMHDGAGRQAEGAPAAQPFGVVVLRLADNDAVAGPEIAERPELSLFQHAFARRDGMAVRVFE